MGWFDDETGAERAARIKGNNQAAEHARKREAKQADYELRQHERWERENAAHKRAEYNADLAAWRNNPTGYERLYDSPADVRDMPGEPFFPIRREYVEPSAQDSAGLPPIVIKIGVGCILLFFVLPALAKTVLPVVGGLINTIWLILLSAVGLLTLLWIILKVTAGDNPERIHRARLFNPLRIGKAIYQVIREHLAERAARKNVEK